MDMKAVFAAVSLLALVVFISGCVQNQQTANVVSITSAPASAGQNEVFAVSWSVQGTGNISHTEIHYGTESVPVAGATGYQKTSANQCTQPCPAGAFSAELAFPGSGTYYYRAHAVIDGKDVWSAEQRIEITGQPAEEPVIGITTAPVSAVAGKPFLVRWSVDGSGTIDHTALHYGTQSVPAPADPAVYTYSSDYQCTGQPCDLPQAFSAMLNISQPGTYYYRAHAVFSGKNIWSDERTVTVNAAQQTKVFTINADDNGFYMGAQQISSIGVDKNDLVKINFAVMTSNVYYNGLDFRGCGVNTTAAPGRSASLQFVAETNCTINSYWPSSGVKKASMLVAAEG